MRCSVPRRIREGVEFNHQAIARMKEQAMSIPNFDNTAVHSLAAKIVLALLQTDNETQPDRLVRWETQRDRPCGSWEFHEAVERVERILESERFSRGAAGP